MILAGALLAAVLLVVAEFTALYQVHVATSLTPIKTVSGGSNHSYAMLVIALAAAALGIDVWRSGSRPALLALGVLGVVGLLIALLGDLPDSHASGLAGSAAHGFVNASSTPSAGLYLETLGAILLIATSGLGFMMLGAPSTRRRPRRGDDPRPDREQAPGNGGRGSRGGGNGGPANQSRSWSRGKRSSS